MIKQDSEESIINVQNLSTYFELSKENVVYAVDGISFDLFKNETLGVVGESGSGKSITALSIMRLLPSKAARISEESGVIFCADDACIDLTALTEKEMVKYRGSGIAMVFQEPMSSLNPTMRCGDQVLEAVLLHNALNKTDGKLRVLSLFEKVKLPDPDRVYKAYPHQLSGGQIQRIMIAMAVAGNPKVLIADEPTTALDVTVQKDILKLLKDVQKEFGTSMIFISHDLAVINQICDRVLVMHKGKIVEQGDTQTIFNEAKHPYTKGLIASRPPQSKKLSRLPSVQDFLDNPDKSKSYFHDKWKISLKELSDRKDWIQNQRVLLEVESLSKTYYSKTNGFFSAKKVTRAVDNISFKLKKGEILGVVGESGSGKSTMAQLVCGLLEPTEGNIKYDNTEISSLKGKDLKLFRKRVQIIFQDPYSALNPRMSIGDSIGEPFAVHDIHNKNERRSMVIKLLEDVGLEGHHYDRYPHEFSGGQRQRIVIARALTLNPELLICDESVSALDVSVQAIILNLLMDIKKKFGVSFLFISHDLAVVRFFSDRIIVMKDGKIVERGFADDVYDNPQHIYTQNLIEAIPKF